MLSNNTNYLYYHDKKIIFIWQARAACSSVAKMYYDQLNLLTKDMLEKRTLIHEFRAKHSKKLVKLSNKALENENTKYIHFVVNPFRRAVSSYIHAMRNNYVNQKDKDISFETFIENLHNNVYEPNMHHDKQLSFLVEKNKNIEYIKMENIKDKLTYLNKKYDLNLKLFENIQTHNKKYNFEKPYIGNLLWSQIGNSNIPDKYHHFYNGKMKNRVYLLYKDDIDTFKYTWDEFIKG